MLWGLAVLSLSGDLGSSANTKGMLQWLLSWMAVLEPARLNMINGNLRKAGHFLAYGIMGFLWFRALRSQVRCGPWPACLWSLGICLAFASLDEGHQWFCNSRGASLWDVLLDMSGVSLAVALTSSFWRAAAVRRHPLRAGQPVIGRE